MARPTRAGADRMAAALMRYRAGAGAGAGSVGLRDGGRLRRLFAGSGRRIGRGRHQHVLRDRALGAVLAGDREAGLLAVLRHVVRHQREDRLHPAAEGAARADVGRTGALLGEQAPRRCPFRSDSRRRSRRRRCRRRIPAHAAPARCGSAPRRAGRASPAVNRAAVAIMRMGEGFLIVFDDFWRVVHRGEIRRTFGAAQGSGHGGLPQDECGKVGAMARLSVILAAISRFDFTPASRPCSPTSALTPPRNLFRLDHARFGGSKPAINR